MSQKASCYRHVPKILGHLVSEVEEQPSEAAQTVSCLLVLVEEELLWEVERPSCHRWRQMMAGQFASYLLQVLEVEVEQWISCRYVQVIPEHSAVQLQA
jgi:hypothetical protein